MSTTVGMKRKASASLMATKFFQRANSGCRQKSGATHTDCSCLLSLSALDPERLGRLFEPLIREFHNLQTDPHRQQFFRDHLADSFSAAESSHSYEFCFKDEVDENYHKVVLCHNATADIFSSGSDLCRRENFRFLCGEMERKTQRKKAKLLLLLERFAAYESFPRLNQSGKPLKIVDFSDPCFEGLGLPLAEMRKICYTSKLQRVVKEALVCAFENDTTRPDDPACQNFLEGHGGKVLRLPDEFLRALEDLEEIGGRGGDAWQYVKKMRRKWGRPSPLSQTGAARKRAPLSCSLHETFPKGLGW